MSQAISGPPLMEAICPFCERQVLVYEDPPRCPLCACPLEECRLIPFVFPGEGQPGRTLGDVSGQ
ncbi:MAG TPA: hypothetical protein VGB19_16055 [Actinomycetota bacterium]